MDTQAEPLSLAAMALDDDDSASDDSASVDSPCWVVRQGHGCWGCVSPRAPAEGLDECWCDRRSEGAADDEPMGPCRCDGEPPAADDVAALYTDDVVAPEGRCWLDCSEKPEPDSETDIDDRLSCSEDEEALADWTDGLAPDDAHRLRQEARAARRAGNPWRADLAQNRQEVADARAEADRELAAEASDSESDAGSESDGGSETASASSSSTDRAEVELQDAEWLADQVGVPAAAAGGPWGRGATGPPHHRAAAARQAAAARRHAAAQHAVRGDAQRRARYASLREELEMRVEQRRTAAVIPRRDFTRLVHELMQDYDYDEYHFTEEALEALREAAEAFAVEQFGRAGRLAAHAGRETVGAEDLILSRALAEN